MTDKELEDMLAIQQMPDAGQWEGTTCPRCGCLVEMRQYGLRSVALTGDETLARYEYRCGAPDPTQLAVRNDPGNTTPN